MAAAGRGRAPYLRADALLGLDLSGSACKSVSDDGVMRIKLEWYRLLKRRLPYSLDGEPAPDLLTRPIPPAEARLLPSGYLSEEPAGGSFGELAVVEEAERD